MSVEELSVDEVS